MASLGQEVGGPPDLVLKLAFQFLEWEDIYQIKLYIFNKVDLVCKNWKRILDEDDDVGRKLCINQVKSYATKLAIQNKNGRRGAEFKARERLTYAHELLVRMMSAPLVEGRTLHSLENESDQFLFASDLSQLTMWSTSNDFKGFNDRSTLNRIFGLPLPANIISAMGEFMVENLYQGSINDVDSNKMLNAFGVRPFLERYCYENPDRPQIVWAHLQQAIENAILVAEGLEAGDVDERQRNTFNEVVTRIVTCCISTRAKCLVPLLRRVEVTQAIMPELIAHVENLANEMDDEPPVLVDTMSYYELYRFRDEKV